MDKAQIKRISKYESLLNEASDALAKLSEALDGYSAIQSHFGSLAKYLESQQWRKDVADDEAGKLPCDLKRGVLSQDGIWNALEAQKELLEQMKELVKCNHIN